MSTFIWATVTAVAPLRIRLDGDVDELPVAPDSLVASDALVIGDRVWCTLVQRRIVLLGRAGGDFDPGDLFDLGARVGVLEDRVALGVIPSSVVVGSGSATVAPDGTVTFTGAASVSLNNVFDGTGGDLYKVYIKFTKSGTAGGATTRLRKAGVDTTSGYTRVVSFKYGYDATGTQGTGGSGSDNIGFLAPQVVTGDIVIAEQFIAEPGKAGITTAKTSSRQIGPATGSVWEEGASAPPGAHDGLTIVRTHPGTLLAGLIKVVKIA